MTQKGVIPAFFSAGTEGPKNTQIDYLIRGGKLSGMGS